MNSYEAKQEARRERLQRAADKAERASEAMYTRSKSYTDGIPFGQPILVGHHSEAGHRRALKRADDAMRRCVELGKRAEQLRGMAHSVGSAGISSDDPEAVVKLREKLAKLEQAQETMKQANQHVRAFQRLVKRGGQGHTESELREKLRERLEALGLPNPLRLLTPDFCGRIGFPDYALQNNGAEIRRCKLRIEQLKAAPTETVESVRAGVRIVENAEANRLQLFFDGKPADNVRAALKSHGFRWARSEGAWQRHLNNGARHVADYMLTQLGFAP